MPPLNEVSFNSLETYFNVYPSTNLDAQRAKQHETVEKSNTSLFITEVALDPTDGDKGKCSVEDDAHNNLSMEGSGLRNNVLNSN